MSLGTAGKGRAEVSLKDPAKCPGRSGKQR